MAGEVFSSVFTPGRPPAPTAEMILFPPEEEGSSEDDEPDWIVSSEDEEEMEEDMKQVLAQLRKPPQPILYHFEAGCKETEHSIIKSTEEEAEGDGVADLEVQLSLHQVLLEAGGGGGGEGVWEGGKESAAAARLRRLLPKMKDQLETVDSYGKL